MAKARASRKEKVALVLGGGAPTLTLMAGALAALDEEGVEFDVISTSGAGMVVGLLYAAAKGGDRQAALRATVDLGVHDAIYARFPVNYKVFYKPGPLAESYYRNWMMPFLKAMPADTDQQRLLRDWAHLWLAAWSPSSLLPESLGLCAPAPWIEDVVDFDAVKKIKPEFFINAWNIREREMRVFHRDEITVDHFRAALAFPFIYPPFELDGDHYIEGSAMDTLNLEALIRHDKVYDDFYPGELRRRLSKHWQAIRAAERLGGEAGLKTAAGLVRSAQKAAHQAALKAKRKVARAEPAAEAATPEDPLDDPTLRASPHCAKALDEAAKVHERLQSIDKIVVFDVLGTEQLIRRPRNLYDAWVLSMIVPLVAISEKNLDLFEKLYDAKPGEPGKFLHRLSFIEEISHDHWPSSLDWSHGNLKAMFHAGERAGRKFLQANPWLGGDGG